jgi:hypothetical protein
MALRTHANTSNAYQRYIYIPSKVQYIKSDVETRKTSIIHCLVFGAKMEQFDFEFDFEHDLSADVGQPAEAPQSMPPSARKNYRQVRSEWGLVA